MVVLILEDGAGDGVERIVRLAAVAAHNSSEAEMLAADGEAPRHGILIGVWDEGDVPEELWSRYLGEKWAISGDTRIAPPR